MGTSEDAGRGDGSGIDGWDRVGLNRLLGIEDFEVDEHGEATARLVLGEHHRNPGGLVHGGALFSLIDSAVAAAMVGRLEEGEWMATESTTIDFLRPAAGTLTARARVDRRGRSTAYASGEAVDEEGRTVARATAVWAIRRDE